MAYGVYVPEFDACCTGMRVCVWSEKEGYVFIHKIHTFYSSQ